MSERAFLYAKECGRFLILDLDPGPLPARPIRRINPLRNNPLKPEFAGMAEHGRAIEGDMLTPPNPGLGLAKQLNQTVATVR